MTQTAEELTAGLEVLEQPQGVTVVTTQGSFIVNTIRMHKFKRFATLAWPLAQDAMGLLDGGGNFGEFIEKHEESVSQLLILSSNLTTQKYEQFYLDDALKMVLAVVEVNMDFFVQNLIPMISSRAGAIKERLDKTLAKAGLTVSSASAAMDTPLKKSKTVH